jgi:hypothetical protein
MPDLLWDDVRNFFDPDRMGSLPDVAVVDASVDDWQTVFDLVRSSGWASEYTEDGVVRPLPSAVDAVACLADRGLIELRVAPVPDVLVIFRLYSVDQIDFDVDLRQLQGQQGLDCLCDFLGAIGRRLGKSVVMMPEGDSGNPVLGFDPAADRVVLLADPQLPNRLG